MQASTFQFSGDQLRLARIAWGRSQDQIGEAVYATRQYIQQLETGAKSPSDEMLHALADVLDVLPNFLRSAPVGSVKPEQCHFRKQMTTPASLTSQALARGTILERIVFQFDTILELPTVNFPDFPVNSFQDIENAAEHARIHWGLGIDAPILNMTRVVENAGAVVTQLGGISEKLDALSMDRPRPIIVRSSTKESACRLRFDIAHETGHLIMHRGITTGDRETEDQANRFASAFLLPRRAMLREFPRGKQLNWSRIFELKTRWKVSAKAIIRRAFDLRLIDATQYRTGNIHLVKTGQAKYERHDDQIPLETPELLQSAADAVEKSGVDRVHAIADCIGIKPRLFAFVTGIDLSPTSELPIGSNVVPFISGKLLKA